MVITSDDIICLRWVKWYVSRIVLLVWQMVTAWCFLFHQHHSAAGLPQQGFPDYCLLYLYSRLVMTGEDLHKHACGVHRETHLLFVNTRHGKLPIQSTLPFSGASIFDESAWSRWCFGKDGTGSTPADMIVFVTHRHWPVRSSSGATSWRRIFTCNVNVQRFVALFSVINGFLPATDNAKVG